MADAIIRTPLDMDGNAVTNAADPTDPQDLATRAFVVASIPVVGTAVINVISDHALSIADEASASTAEATLSDPTAFPLVLVHAERNGTGAAVEVGAGKQAEWSMTTRLDGGARKVLVTVYNNAGFTVDAYVSILEQVP